MFLQNYLTHYSSELRGLDLEFRQGIDKSVLLENTYFMGLISSQIKHKMMTLLMTAEAGYKTSIH